jgi:FkbM family methyltransferase
MGSYVKLTETSIKTLTNFYWLARKSRLLDTVLGQRAFAASYFLYKRYLEDPYHDLVERHPELFRGGNILDIGANIGYTATVFGRAVDPEYKVYAFEPERFNYDLLERSARAQKSLQRIVPIKSAVGDREGIIELWENEHHHGDHRILTDQFRQTVASSRVVSTPIIPVDSFVAKQPVEFPVRFIKIDVQGYEFPVCRGMERTLSANPRAILALEYMPGAMRELGFQPEELIIWLQQREYKVYTLEKHGRFRPGVADISGGHSYADLLFSSENLSELA